MKKFADHFSSTAKTYAAIRPRYPKELFDYVVSHCLNTNLAWDVATGNGQSASGLTSHFRKIVASDPSEAQLNEAFLHPDIEYRHERSEKSTLDDQSVDCVTVATAVHWFDLEAFYCEVDRVLKPGGVLALWSYGGARIAGEIGEKMEEFAFDFLKDYWMMHTRMNWVDKYVSLPFPYKDLGWPAFQVRKTWGLAELESYFESWSGLKCYREETGVDPLPELMQEMEQLVEGETFEIVWDIFGKLGRKSMD